MGCGLTLYAVCWQMCCFSSVLMTYCKHSLTRQVTLFQRPVNGIEVAPALQSQWFTLKVYQKLSSYKWWKWIHLTLEVIKITNLTLKCFKMFFFCYNNEDSCVLLYTITTISIWCKILHTCHTPVTMTRTSTFFGKFLAGFARQPWEKNPFFYISCRPIYTRMLIKQNKWHLITVSICLPCVHITYYQPHYILPATQKLPLRHGWAGS